MGNNFKFRAAQANGQIIEGTISAGSRDEAFSILRARNQSPIQITEDNSKTAGLKILNKNKKVKVADLAVFCKQLSAMLNTGMPINKALDIQEAQTENPTLRTSLQEVSKAIKQGEGLSKAMKAYPKSFPKILVTMIEAGEATGKLDEVLERMSNHYTKENKINNKVSGAMVYPLVLMVLTVVAVAAMMIVVIPMFRSMFGEVGMELPLITKIVIGISDSLVGFWYIYLAVIGGAFVSIKNYLKTDVGKFQYDKFLMNNKILAKPIQQIITSRFTRTMSTLMQSGISVVNALSISADTTNNVIVTSKVSEATDGVKRGMSLTGELRKTGIFPMMMISMLGVGEETGTIDDLMLKTADYYDEELDAGISKLLAMIEPAMILIMGVIIGGVVMSIMIPMFTMSTSPEMYQ